MNSDEALSNLKRSIFRSVDLVEKINNVYNSQGQQSNSPEIKTLKTTLKNEVKNSLGVLEDVSLVKPLPKLDIISKTVEGDSTPQALEIQRKKLNLVMAFNRRRIEKKIHSEKLQRKLDKELNKEDSSKKKVQDRFTKPRRLSNKLFSSFSLYLIDQGLFERLETDLIKANMRFLPKIYVSIMLFSTLLAFILSIFVLLFLLFFNIVPTLPFITLTDETFIERFLKYFWVLIIFPAGTFLFSYFYPSLERASIERKISHELPFATINMAAISGSLINPTQIFKIIIATKEYPTLEKEFTKILNGVNVLGHDLIYVLRNTATNSPSRKLSDLFNGLATTINSGGDLPKFFEERANNLLFEYKLEQEKDTRAAETFMDIYISVVIAAPMILMLLMVMIQISGLGVSFGISTITTIMVMGVSLINLVFLSFLHIKQPKD